MNKSEKLLQAVQTWLEERSGEEPTAESVEKVAKRFKINADTLKREILISGIKDGWLIDEFFK